MKKTDYEKLDVDDKMSYSITRHILCVCIFAICLLTVCCQTERYWQKSIEKQKLEYTQKYIDKISETVKEIFVMVCK